MRHDDEDGEEVGACQKKKRTRAQDQVLAQQHHGRDQVVDEEGGLIGWNKGWNRRERHLGEGRQR
jgi:hypothetical protein